MSPHNLLLVFCILMSDATTDSQVYSEEPYCVSKEGFKNCPALEAKQVHSHANEEFRILLVGKTGVGKSATGNTILQRQVFKSAHTAHKDCEKAYGVVNDRKLSVINFPGLDTLLNAEDEVNSIIKCIQFSAPGLHVFLVVIEIERFTEEDEKNLHLFQKIYGEDFYDYTIALFTGADELKEKSIHQFIHDNQKLQNFIKKCRSHYHVFNNEDKNPSQVIKLLENIDKIVAGNGGKYYTTEMQQQAERAVEEEKERILKKREAEWQELYKTLKKKYSGQMLHNAMIERRMQFEEMARYEAEQSPLLALKSIYSSVIAEQLKTFFNAIKSAIYNFLSNRFWF